MNVRSYIMFQHVSANSVILRKISDVATGRCLADVSGITDQIHIYATHCKVAHYLLHNLWIINKHLSYIFDLPALIYYSITATCIKHFRLQILFRIVSLYISGLGVHVERNVCGITKYRGTSFGRGKGTAICVQA
jgi:hypothetical protein